MIERWARGKMMDRRAFLRRGIGGAAGSALAAAAWPGARCRAQAQTRAAVQFGWVKTVEFAGSFIADDRGYYKAEGLDVDMLSGGPGIDVVTAIVSGRAMFGCG